MGIMHHSPERRDREEAYRVVESFSTEEWTNKAWFDCIEEELSRGELDRAVDLLGELTNNHTIGEAAAVLVAWAVEHDRPVVACDVLDSLRDQRNHWLHGMLDAAKSLTGIRGGAEHPAWRGFTEVAFRDVGVYGDDRKEAYARLFSLE